MKEIKTLKYNGDKIKIRVMRPDEIINERTLFSNFENGPFFKSGSIGDLVSDHPDRFYVEVLSL